MAFKYTPDEVLDVHKEGAVRLICSEFQSHEGGLPEWVKNSSDEYARRNTAPSDRVIVVIFDQGTRRRGKGIGVLDFGGMTPATIEGNFRVWADPDAATRNAPGIQVQGGHGNGGKCYMSMMFSEHAEIRTVSEGGGSRYGVAANSFQFGYIPDAAQSRGYPVADRQAELEDALRDLGVTFAGLPDNARAAFEIANGFTLVMGREPKGYSRRIPVQELVQSIKNHPQTTRAVELCHVYVMERGRIVGGGPLAHETIPPSSEFPEPVEIPIPDELLDPLTTDVIQAVTPGDEKGRLILRTSEVRMTRSHRHRHSITYFADDDFLGFTPVEALNLQSSYLWKVYGECQLKSLADFKTNARTNLAESPLTRAVESWVAEQFSNFCRDWEQRERRDRTQQGQSELSRINEALDQWKNQFMSRHFTTLWGGLRGGGDPVPPLPRGTPTRIELSLSHAHAGVGVSFRPNIRFFQEERRIQPTPFDWQVDDTNVALVDEDLNVINTFAPGVTKIWAETRDRKLTSEQVTLEVVDIQDMEVVPRTMSVAVGSRSSLSAMCTLRGGGRSTSDIYLIWNEANPAVASVSAAGLVWGREVGETEIVAADDRCAAAPSLVTVVESTEKDRRQGFPKILISGIDPDPETGESVQLSRDVPPVYQRPRDVELNVWWINSEAPFADLYLDESRGFGYESREWRMYHIERYTEIMVYIALLAGPDAELLDQTDWLARLGDQMSEVQGKAARALTPFITEGRLPEAM